MKQKLRGWRWRQALETTVPPMEAAALSWAAKRTKMRSSQGAATLRNNSDESYYKNKNNPPPGLLVVRSIKLTGTSVEMESVVR